MNVMCSNVNKMAKQSDHSHTKSSNKQRRPKIPQCEVVNEIQIVSNKKENQHNSNIVTTPTTPTSPNDNNKDKTKNCRRRSSIDLSVTTPTTVTTSTTAPPIAKSRSRDKDKSGGTICMCGKLLKRVKGILDRKDKKDGSKYLNIKLYVNFFIHSSVFCLKYVFVCICAKCV